MEVKEALLGFLYKRILSLSFLITTIIGILACSQNSDILSLETESQSENFEGLLIDGSLNEEGSCLSYYSENEDFYTPVSIVISNGSFLRVPIKSLRPPQDFIGKVVEITMEVTRDQESNELIFTFGPHGCEFTQPAELCLSWKTTNSSNATLYYLDENNNKREHIPDQIDLDNKRMIIYINHFSRYAVAYSN
jgi:hypothetical protein